MQRNTRRPTVEGAAVRARRLRSRTWTLVPRTTRMKCASSAIRAPAGVLGANRWAPRRAPCPQEVKGFFASGKGFYPDEAVQFPPLACQAFPPNQGEGLQEAHRLGVLTGAHPESIGQFVRAQDAGVAVPAHVRAPRTVRSAALSVIRIAMTLPSARNRGLRSPTMLDRGYGPSPLLDAADRAAGARLPEPELRSS